MLKLHKIPQALRMWEKIRLEHRQRQGQHRYLQIKGLQSYQRKKCGLSQNNNLSLATMIMRQNSATLMVSCERQHQWLRSVIMACALNQGHPGQAFRLSPWCLATIIIRHKGACQGSLFQEAHADGSSQTLALISGIMAYSPQHVVSRFGGARKARSSNLCLHKMQSLRFVKI